MNHIRNFCIIAHIDHGKSTLADRLLERTNTVDAKDMEAQVLDDMDLERERGITIKSHAIQMEWTLDGERYILNLIDTPGHVDFSYEVSRSIAACEGALLIVDASQGIQAQTISNLYMAIENDLEIIPVLNKCDLDSAKPDEVEDQIVDLLGCDRSEVIRASGKTGMGVDDILRGDHPSYPGAQRRSRSSATGSDLRLRVQSVPGNHSLFQNCQRYDPYGRFRKVCRHRQGIPCRRDRSAQARNVSPQGPVGRKRGIHHLPV